MATPPTDPTMQIPSPELVKRIESLVSSLLGVTESHVDRDESGAIRSLHASIAPGHSPDRVRREIRSALLSSLDLELSPEVVNVDTEEQMGRRQEQFWEAPAESAGGGDGAPDLGFDDATEGGLAGDSDLGGSDADDSRTEERVGDALEAESIEETPGPEQWLARADAPPRPRPGTREAERWPAEDRRTGEDRRSRGDRRSDEDRRSPEGRRSGGDRRSDADRRAWDDRRSDEDRRDWEDRRDGEDRRSGIDRRETEREDETAGQREGRSRGSAGAGGEETPRVDAGSESSRATGRGEAEIPSAAYIDAIIERLRAREGASVPAPPEASDDSSATQAGSTSGSEPTVEPGSKSEAESSAESSGSTPGAGSPSRGGVAAGGPSTPDRAEPAPASEEAPAEAPADAIPGQGGPTGSLLPLSLGEYVLLGGGADDRGVELRIRVEAGGERYVGTVRVGSLEDVSPGLFVGATLRAVERALDARPVTDRSSRILILEAVDMEEVLLRQGRFVTATVQAVHRDGESRATGLVPADGRIVREAAAEAALDAVARLLQDRHTWKVEGPGRIRRGPEGRSEDASGRRRAGSRGGAGGGGSAVAGAHDAGGAGGAAGSGRGGGQGGRAGAGRGQETRGSSRSAGGRGRDRDQDFMRDPFNIWE